MLKGDLLKEHAVPTRFDCPAEAVKGRVLAGHRVAGSERDVAILTICIPEHRTVHGDLGTRFAATAPRFTRFLEPGEAVAIAFDDPRRPGLAEAARRRETHVVRIGGAGRSAGLRIPARRDGVDGRRLTLDVLGRSTEAATACAWPWRTRTRP